MELGNICSLYFSSMPYKTLVHDDSDLRHRVICTAVILSYFTVIIPAGLGLALLASKLVDRCKQMKGDDAEAAKCSIKNFNPFINFADVFKNIK